MVNKHSSLLLEQKAKVIKLFIFDVDGILTSGHIYYGPHESKWRAFHVHDGYGIKLLQQAGIKVGIISAKKSIEVKNRLDDLGICHQYLGDENKLPAYLALKNELNMDDQQIAYMGDDFPDLALLKRVGLSVTVPEACAYIKNTVHYVTKRSGGEGAVREIAEWLLTIQGHYPAMIESYYADQL